MIQKPKGTKDIFGKDEKIYRYIFDIFEQLAHSFNIRKIITPTFEHLELFKTSGEQSDIVTKELYSFEDLGGRKIALRPEGTAPVGRAIVENKLFNDKQYNKLYYIGPMYRYEKPQKGRLRQFYQIGVEFTNELNTNSIIDVIVLAWKYLKQLNIDDFVLCINSLGTDEERNNYINELKSYFRKHKDQLSQLSQNRIETNPLRILDDKVDSELDVVKQAPKIYQFYSEQTKKEFDDVLNVLKNLNIDYKIDYSLVRGLDYYSSIVFEFVSNSKYLGSKTTLIGGGCYLDLIKNNESNKINGVGFGVGVERLFEIISVSNSIKIDNNIDVMFLLENDNQYNQIRSIIYELRDLNICCEYNYKIRKFNKLFEEARKNDPQFIIFQDISQHNSELWSIKEKDNPKNYIVKLNEIINLIKSKI